MSSNCYKESCKGELINSVLLNPKPSCPGIHPWGLDTARIVGYDRFIFHGGGSVTGEGWRHN